MKKPGTDYVVLTGPNKDKISEALLTIKGPGRTMAEFAADTNINQSKLSRILNKNYKDSLPLSLLETLIAASCEGSNVTLEQLIEYNGMVKKAEANRIKHSTNMYATQMVRRQMKDIIASALFSRGIMMRKIGYTDDSGSHKISAIPDTLACDMAVILPEYGDIEWGFLMLPVLNDEDDTEFDIKYFIRRVVGRYAYVFLHDAWTPEDAANQKFSFVFSNKPYYEEFIEALNIAKLNNRFSAILVDISEKDVVEEHIFPSSNYKNESSLFKAPVLEDRHKEDIHEDYRLSEED